MSSDSEQLARAQSVLDAAERGEYDAALGIAPDLRVVMQRIDAKEPLDETDLSVLSRHNEPGLIDQANDLGLFDALLNGENR